MPNRKIILVPVCLIVAWAASACGLKPLPTATLTIPVATTSPVPFTATLTPTTAPSRTATPSPSATNTLSPSPTPTLVPTAANTPTPTLTPTATSYPPIVHPNWTSYTNGNYIRALLVDRDGSLWSGGSGGVVHWNIETGKYVKYTTEHGLASNWVTSIAQTTDGAVWFGTAVGASRFKDGMWTTYTKKDGLAGDNVIAIAATPDGNVWFGGEGGVTRFDGQNWKVYSDLSGSAFAIAPDGTLWAAGKYYEISYFDGSEWKSTKYPVVATRQYSLIDVYISALAVGPDGTVWVGTDYALHRFDGKNWLAFNPWRAYQDIGVTSLTFAPDGALWIGLGYQGYIHRENAFREVSTPGVYRFDGYQWQLFTTQDGFLENETRAITWGKDGSAYFGYFDRGFSRFDGKNWKAFQTDDRLLDNIPTTIAVSDKGVVWSGFSQGALQYDGKDWRAYQQLGELGKNDVQLLFIDPDQNIWFGNGKGLAKFDGQIWTTYNSSRFSFLSYIKAITALPDGMLFSGGWYGAGIFDGQNWTEVQVPTIGRDANDVQALLDGTVWIGNGEGLYLYDGKNVKAKYFYTDTTWKVFNDLALAPDGTLWASVEEEGIYQLAQNHWKIYYKKFSLPDIRYWNIVVAPDGTVWAGASNYLVHFDGLAWITYPVPDSITDLAFSPDGSLWVASTGIYHYFPPLTNLPRITPTPLPTPTQYLTASPTPIRTPHPAQIEDDSGSKMSLVAAGSFVMGHNDVYSNGESPEHTVYLNDFYIDRYEVTNLQFSTFLNAKGNQIEGGTTWLDTHTHHLGLYYLGGGKWQPVEGSQNLPVVGATWFGANAYCEWRGSRLPTEAEWEKAARGRLARKLFPWGDSDPVCDQQAKNGANYEGFDYTGNCSGLHPVGDFLPNGYGLYDMAGNVAEWVADWYSYDYYPTLPPGVANPQGPDTGTYRVVRGGSWQEIFYSLRVFDRSSNSPEAGSSDIGFRCVSQP